MGGKHYISTSFLFRAGEIAQQLRALAALPEDMVFNPQHPKAAVITTVCGFRSVPGNPMPSSGLHRFQTHMGCLGIHAGKTSTHIQ